MWISALNEDCSWQERLTEILKGAGISLRLVYLRDILLNNIRDIKSIDQEISTFWNPREIIIGCLSPERLK